MANSKRSWLDGPEIPAEYDESPSRWPGEKLGLPKSGVGALASVGRRSIGVAIDWVICWIISGFTHMFTHALGGVSTMTLFLFVLMGIVSVALFARTPGQAVLGMGVARVDAAGQRVGLWRAIARSLFTVVILPAVMVDTDGRGMHDRATGTAVILG